MRDVVYNEHQRDKGGNVVGIDPWMPGAIRKGYDRRPEHRGRAFQDQPGNKAGRHGDKEYNIHDHFQTDRSIPCSSYNDVHKSGAKGSPVEPDMSHYAEYRNNSRKSVQVKPDESALTQCRCGKCPVANMKAEKQNKSR